MSDQNFTIARPNGVKVDVTLGARGKHSRQKLRLQQTTAIPGRFLDARAEERKAGGRAPLGDSHGAFQKVAEIPLALLIAKLPRDQWEDQKALAKLLNDPDLAKLRSDREGRRF